MELKVYIENLESNAEESKRAWFNLPVNYNDLQEQIGIKTIIDRFKIIGYDLPFSVDEDVTLGELNRWAKEIEEMNPPINECENCFEKLLKYHHNNIDELYHANNHIRFYPGMKNFRELADYLYEDEYISPWGIAEDALELEGQGNYILTDCGIFECVLYGDQMF